MSSGKVEFLKRGELGVITIQNPPMNSLSGEVLIAIREALDAIKADANIKASVITGKGLFSAGAEVREIWDIAKSGDKAKGLELLAKANSVVNAVQDLGKPVIAVIDGYCLGGGNELAMACTARIASEQAKFGQPEINLGIMPGMGGTQRLPRLIELEPALMLLLSGAVISAKDALAYGLVDKVVPQKDLLAEAKLFVKQVLSAPLTRTKIEFTQAKLDAILEKKNFQTLMASKSDHAVVSIQVAVRVGMLESLADGLRGEQQLFADLVLKDSAKKGLAKFLKINLEPEKAEVPAAKPEEKSVSSDEKAETLKMFREMVRDFAESEIRPKIEKMETDGCVMRDLFAKMGELGFFGACFPEEYGGAGLGKEAYCTVFEELGRVHGSSAVLFGAHAGLACGAVAISGTDAQKQKYLRGGIEGKMLGAFALTEPGAGSDAGNIKTMAVKTDGGWMLNGAKQFITNGGGADFAVVIAQTDSFLKKDGLTAFIVETKSKGFSVGKIEHKIGIRGSQTAELIFQDVFVPDENLLGGIGHGFKIFMKTLNGGRLGLGAACTGASKRALELAFKHASERQQFDQPLLMNEVIQFYLARIRANIYVMEQAVYSAARKADRGEDVRLEAACVKLMCSELNHWNIDTALQIHGGYGFCEEYEIARMYRDERINLLFEGTNEIQQLLIFKEVYSAQGKS